MSFPHATTTFRSLNDAYHASLEELYLHGSDVPGITDRTSVGSNFGKKTRGTRELLGHKFEIEDPMDRIVRRETRPINLGYAIASFLWFMSGNDAGEMICFYNARGRMFLDGDKFQCALGARVIGTPIGDQVELAISTIRLDSATRRAAIAVFLPADLATKPRDTPCLFGLQFFVRSGRLICVATMRSQSAAMVLPYDAFLFTMLQEYVSLRLGVQIGSYVHLSHSFHYYEDEVDVVSAALHQRVATPAPMPRMPTLFASELRQLLDREQQMRLRLVQNARRRVADLFVGLSWYSRELLSCLVDVARKSLGVARLEDDPPLPGWYVDAIE